MQPILPGRASRRAPLVDPVHPALPVDPVHGGSLCSDWRAEAFSCRRLGAACARTASHLLRIGVLFIWLRRDVH